jgi:NAD(P)-dependent dehydrogenase (short-subunit alcohol dehydrogenase family)
MKNFKDKVAIVTGGGGSGIGHHLVMELARRGAKVAFCDIVNLDATQGQLAAIKADSCSETVDMGDKSAINIFVDNMLARFGQIDLLINNAGIALGDRTFAEVSEQDFEKITDINYWGVIHFAGCAKNIGRIFISDGRAQNILARLMPTSYIPVVSLILKMSGIKVP